MPEDRYGAHADNNVSAMGDDWEAITPNDNADLPKRYRYIINIAATDGTVSCTGKTAAATAIPVKAGQPLFVRPMRIRSTGTSNVTLIGII